MSDINELTAKLKAAAERQKSILAYIASYEPGDIDSDTVDLRFEDENDCDTGCDVSIVEECRRSADLFGELIAALEAAEKRVAELSAHLSNAHAFIENTEAFGHEAATGIIKCGDAEWNIDNSKVALSVAGINLETGGEA
ncbi:hypothetical protein [Cronobacter dublinensis]|uniref:hypothetical protein n=1 Tax=Cronobacter dublinensis TaxID=413497 RepID=UPI0024AF6CC3|nr:hypothetical protein [Cronobacter dublinensis]MDI7502008.1 hypothetical protein [Cronobacter dublinensis]